MHATERPKAMQEHFEKVFRHAHALMRQPNGPAARIGWKLLYRAARDLAQAASVEDRGSHKQSRKDGSREVQVVTGYNREERCWLTLLTLKGTGTAQTILVTEEGEMRRLS